MALVSINSLFNKRNQGKVSSSEDNQSCHHPLSWLFNQVIHCNQDAERWEEFGGPRSFVLSEIFVLLLGGVSIRPCLDVLLNFVVKKQPGHLGGIFSCGVWCRANSCFL